MPRCSSLRGWVTSSLGGQARCCTKQSPLCSCCQGRSCHVGGGAMVPSVPCQAAASLASLPTC